MMVEVQLGTPVQSTLPSTRNGRCYMKHKAKAQKYSSCKHGPTSAPCSSFPTPDWEASTSDSNPEIAGKYGSERNQENGKGKCGLQGEKLEGSTKHYRYRWYFSSNSADVGLRVMIRLFGMLLNINKVKTMHHFQVP